MDIQRAVFVFGSNRRGIHGAGAALHARKWFGAIDGQGEGPMGSWVERGLSRPACYAIPTKEDPKRSLPLDAVAGHVEAFLAYARQMPSIPFQVTRIGCGLAGFSDSQIAPMFENAPSNCMLPGVWVARKHLETARVIVAGNLGALSKVGAFRKLGTLTKNLWSWGGLEFVPRMGDAVADLFVEQADRSGLSWPATRISAQPERFGAEAQSVRDQQLLWYSTHLIAFDDGIDVTTRRFISDAKKSGIAVRVVSV